MNDLTKEVVTKVAMANKAAARKNDITFDFMVRDEHWNTLIGLHGWRLKERSLNLWRLWHPEHFELANDGHWYIKDFLPCGFEADLLLSRIVGRVLKRKIAREPALWLDDWGDLGKVTVDPQLKLF